jgi:uncharacterized membrane protein YfcA
VRLSTYVFEIVVLLLAAVLQGFLGFGFGIFAMAGLTMTTGLVQAAGVVNIASLVVMVTVIWMLRRHVLWKGVGRLLPGVMVGVALGVTALGAFDGRLLIRVLGVYILGCAVVNIAVRRLPPRESVLADVLVGLFSGALSGAFNTGGPPLVVHLYRRPESPAALKGTIQALFLAMGLTRLPLAIVEGQLGAAAWTGAALGLPGVLAGLAAGLALGRRVPAARFRRVAWAALGVLGLVLLVR